MASTFVKKLPSTAYYGIRAPGNWYRDMRQDVELLRKHDRFSTCITVILSCLDALAAGTGIASSGKFERFVKQHLPALCADLDGTVTGKSGAHVLYDMFRNGFAHTRGPKSGFATGDNSELEGHWAGILDVEGKGRLVAINAILFIDAFLRLITDLENRAA